MQFADAQCYRCKHFREDFTCGAFPDPAVQAIPEEIMGNEHDHRQPYPGDHGIRFEPKEEKEKKEP